MVSPWTLSPRLVKLRDFLTFFFKVLSCLAVLLRKQDLEAWGYPVTLQVYHGLLSFTVHAKPKVRLIGCPSESACQSQVGKVTLEFWFVFGLLYVHVSGVCTCL